MKPTIGWGRPYSRHFDMRIKWHWFDGTKSLCGTYNHTPNVKIATYQARVRSVCCFSCWRKRQKELEAGK